MSLKNEPASEPLPIFVSSTQTRNPETGNQVTFTNLAIDRAGEGYSIRFQVNLLRVMKIRDTMQKSKMRKIRTIREVPPYLLMCVYVSLIF